MNRRLSKANTNYQSQKYPNEHLFRKQSFNDQPWNLFATHAQTFNNLTTNLTLFFDNPQMLLGCKKLQHYSQAQRLREGVYILMRGKIRVLLCKQSKNTSKIEIDHAICKMENRPVAKYCLSTNKLNIIQASQPFQLVMSSNNCLALPKTYFWFISTQELIQHHFYERIHKINQLLTTNIKIFFVNPQLTFIYKQIVLYFRNQIKLSNQFELAVIKSGSVLVQWTQNIFQKLIIGQGEVIIKNQKYQYFCESSEVQLLAVRSNKTYQYYSNPLWTNPPIATPPTLPKQQSKRQILLFRSRSLNVERLVGKTVSKSQFKKSISVKNTQKKDNCIFVSQSAPIPNNHFNKLNWNLLRKIESYQIASNTRSAIEYQRIRSIKQRFRKQKQKQRQKQYLFNNEAILSKKPFNGKKSFTNLLKSRDLNSSKSQLFRSTTNSFKRCYNQ